jgi:hypothetical protein
MSSTGPTIAKQKKALAHELTHLFANAADHGYINDSTKPRGGYQGLDGNPVEVELSDRLENASTYEQFLGEFYIP